MSQLVNAIKSHKKLFALLLGFISLIAIMYYLNKHKPLPVTATSTKRENITRHVTASGETSLENRYSVYAQVAGNVKSVFYKTGAQVTAGDKILGLNPLSLKSTMDNEWSGYLTAKANFDNNYSDILAAEADVKAKKLIRDHAQERFNEDGTPDNKEELRTAQSNYEAAEAARVSYQNNRSALSQAVNSAYSSYLSAKYNYENAAATSPVTGILVMDDLSEGQLVASGQKLFSVIGSGTLRFVAEIDETDVSGVRIGQKTEVRLDSYPGKKFEGTIVEIAGKTELAASGATVVKAQVELNNATILPIIGLSGEARIDTEGKENALVIPIDYIQEDSQGDFVWVEQKGKAKKARVELGIQNDTLQEVVSGLNEGDTVIKGEFIKEGVRVVKSS